MLRRSKEPERGRRKTANPDLWGGRIRRQGSGYAYTSARIHVWEETLRELEWEHLEAAATHSKRDFR